MSFLARWAFSHPGGDGGGGDLRMMSAPLRLGVPENLPPGDASYASGAFQDLLTGLARDDSFGVYRPRAVRSGRGAGSGLFIL